MADAARSTGRRMPFMAVLATALLCACRTTSDPSTGAAGVVPVTGEITATSPQETIDHFFAFYFGVYGSAVPNAAQRSLLAPLVTEDFLLALEAAARAERCAYEKTRGSEPPLIQGDIFSSLFEKASSVISIAEISSDGDSKKYAIGLELRAPGAAAAEVQWTDSVILRNVRGAWLIDDFIHEGTWEFTNRGSVKSMLKSVALHCNK